jgi:hypothetical protein
MKEDAPGDEFLKKLLPVFELSVGVVMMRRFCMKRVFTMDVTKSGRSSWSMDETFEVGM